jgi:WD40 repeat-containing protein SMU1
VQLAPSGGLFVCSQGNRAYMLNAKDGSTIMSYSAGKTSAQKGDFLCGTISAQGHYVYAAAEDGRLYSFDTKTGSVHSTVELASHGVGAKTVGLERARETLGVEHHPCRNLLVTFSAAGSLVLWRP